MFEAEREPLGKRGVAIEDTVVEPDVQLCYTNSA